MSESGRQRMISAEATVGAQYEIASREAIAKRDAAQKAAHEAGDGKFALVLTAIFAVMIGSILLAGWLYSHYHHITH